MCGSGEARTGDSVLRGELELGQDKPKPGTPRQDKPRPSPAPPKQQRQVVRYLVTNVVDGDTVTVAKAGGTTIRIIGIDTPETVHPFEPVECGGPRASAAATALLAGQRVQLVYDPSQGRLDTYDRTLAYLTVPGLGDFGLAMVRRGLAAEYTYDTAYPKQAQYQQAESQAQSQDNGIWATCGGVDTPLATPEPPPNPQPNALPKGPDLAPLRAGVAGGGEGRGMAKQGDAGVVTEADRCR